MATFRALGVIGKPFFHVKHVPAVRTALAPGVDAAHDTVAHSAFRTLQRFAFGAIATHFVGHEATAIAAIHMHRRRLLVHLAHRLQPG